jgi:Zn-dependent peptidase ImmA (M78 family)
MRLIAILTLIALLSCKKENNTEIPRPMQHHVNSFISDGQKYGVNLSLDRLRIKEVDYIRESVRGAYYESEHLILIDTSSWVYKQQAKWLLYHELGHALLKLPESEKEGIMNQMPRDWHSNSEKYIKELFEIKGLNI